MEGSRHLSLRVGSNQSDGWRGATYKSGSGTNTLVFGYTVQTADRDDNGVRMVGTWTENGEVVGLGGSGTVKVKNTNTVVAPTFTGLSDQSSHKVDGRPYASGFRITSTPASRSDTYGRDEIIQVTVNFGQNVTANEWATVFVHMDSTRGEAAYTSGNGTDRLVFEYAVRQGDEDEDGVSASLPQGQNIKATGTDISYDAYPYGVLSSSWEYASHKVDSSLIGNDVTAPTVYLVQIMRNPGPGGDLTYTTGDWIGVEVIFTESVVVSGAPQVQLIIGGEYRQANFNHFPDILQTRGLGQLITAEVPDGPSPSTDASRVRFGYTVQEGDYDGDGISVNNNAITLNGGAIKDDAGNDALLNHDYLVDDSDHKVDAPDNTAPTVSSLAITSDPGDDDTYSTGDAITVKVTFSEDVTVTGTPQLELDLGGTAKTAELTSAADHEATFSYTVAHGDSAPDGIAIGANKISLNSGTVKDGADNDAELSHDAVDVHSGHKVDTLDTTAPAVSFITISSRPGDDNTYGLGDSIEIGVAFDEDVTVTGSPQLELDIGGNARTASYTSATGPTVVFTYTVALDESDTDGIAVAANKLSLNGGTIQDEAGNDAELTHSALAADVGHMVDGADTTAPIITSVSFTSDAGNDYTYATGDVIKVTVTFNEDVTVSGTPLLELDMYESDPPDRLATYSSSDTGSSGANMVFEYTVGLGDRASDGLGIGANKLTLDGGMIQDASGNDADLTHSAVSADPDHFVNGAGGV